MILHTWTGAGIEIVLGGGGTQGTPCRTPLQCAVTKVVGVRMHLSLENKGHFLSKDGERESGQVPAIT